MTVLAGLLLVACNNSQTSAPVPGPGTSVQPADAVSVLRPADTSSDSGNDPSAEEDDAAAQDLLEHHRYHVGGLTGFTLMSLDTLGVPDERHAQIENIQTTLQAAMAPVHDAERGLLATLASGVAAGKVDAQEVDLAIAHIKNTAEASRGATANTMTQLHAALTAVERSTLIDKIVANWEVWRTANAEEADAGAEGHQRTCRLSRLSDEVGLSADQIDKIRTELRAPPATLPDVSNSELVNDVGTRLHAFGVAFESDSFDARSVASCNGADGHLAAAGATRMARFFAVAAPFLTGGQRTTLAAHLREHMSNTGVEATAK